MILLMRILSAVAAITFVALVRAGLEQLGVPGKFAGAVFYLVCTVYLVQWAGEWIESKISGAESRLRAEIQRLDI